MGSTTPLLAFAATTVGQKPVPVNLTNAAARPCVAHSPFCNGLFHLKAQHHLIFLTQNTTSCDRFGELL